MKEQQMDEQSFKDKELGASEPKDLSGHYENGVKVRDLTPEEVEEIKLDHLMGDEE